MAVTKSIKKILILVATQFSKLVAIIQILFKIQNKFVLSEIVRIE